MSVLLSRPDALLTGPDFRSDNLKIERANVDAGVDDLTRFAHGGLPLHGPIGRSWPLFSLQRLAFSLVCRRGTAWDALGTAFGTAKTLTKPA